MPDPIKKSSWNTQQQKIKKEKDAKLQALLAQEKPVFKEKTFEEKLAERLNEEKLANIKKVDNTRVAKKELPKKITNEQTLKKVKEALYRDPFKPNNISSGDKSVDFIYNNEWLMDVPILGGYIKDKAKEIAINSGGTQTVKDIKAKNNLAYTGDFGNNNRATLIDQYFSERPLLEQAKYKPSDDYLEFLPTYSIKGDFDIENKFDKINSILKENVFSDPQQYEEFKKNKKPIFLKADIGLADMLGVDLGSYKTGVGWDKDKNLPYISVSDAWDFEPSEYSKKWVNDKDKGGAEQEKAFIQSYLMHKIGNPFKIYDRFYFDPDSKEYRPQYKMGGYLKQQTNNTNNNMLNEFNEGGSHEQNPLGGIPQGMGQNGQMNTVEEGETRKDDFIYSDRITLTPQVISQFNLPKSLANKTVADATKLINNKFKDRSSKIDESTKKSFLDRIAEAQETIKAEEQAELNAKMQMNSEETPDMMQGQIPQGMEEFTQPQQQMFDGGYLNLASTTLDLGNQMFNKPKIDNSGETDINPNLIKPGQMVASNALKGAQSGMMFGPIGGAVGGVVGGAVGLISGNKLKKQAELAHNNYTKGKYFDNYLNVENNNGVNMSAYGGNLGPVDLYGNKTYSSQYDDPSYTGEGPAGFFKKPLMASTSNFNSELTNNYTPKIVPTVFRQNTKDILPQTTSETTEGPVRKFGPQSIGHTNYQKFKNVKDKVGNFLNNTGETLGENTDKLRYAPIAMNAFQLATMGKPEVEKLDRLNNKYTKQYLDEKTYENIARQQASMASNAIGRSGVSTGQLINANLATQLNATKGISNAYDQIKRHNIDEEKMRQQVEFGNNQTNLQQSNNEKDINARNRGAFKTERSRLLGQLGNDLGAVGKEEVYKELAAKTFGYKWNGEYFVDTKGNKMSAKDMQSKIDSEITNDENTKAFGGFMKNTKFKRY